MNTKTPTDYYQEQLQQAEVLFNKYLKKRKRLGWTRLGCIVAPVVAAYIFIPQQMPYAIIAIAAGIICFFRAVSLDTDNDALIAFQERHIRIIRNELSCLTNQYSHLNSGNQFEPAEHSYAKDIDIFGAWSLYQYMNRCESEQGKGLMANHFLRPLPADRIPAYQEAITELSTETEWRQQLQNYGQSAAITQTTEKRVQQWLQTPNDFFNKPIWRILLMVYPIVPLSALTLYITGTITGTRLLGILFLLIIITSSLSKRITVIHSYAISRIMPEINTLQLQLEHIEQQQWKASALIQVQQLLQSSGHKGAEELRMFKSDSKRFDYRLSAFVIPFLNGFFMWDIRQAVALQQWQQRNKDGVVNQYQKHRTNGSI